MEHLQYFIDKALHGENDSDKHFLLFFSLVVGSNAKTIIELGVRHGDSTLPLVLAAKETGGMVHSVDIEPTSLELEKSLKLFNKFYQKDAVQFLEEWNAQDDIDLILIDDWHSYKQVKRELELLDKLVSPNTIILLHDLMYGETCPFYHTDLTLKDGQWAEGGPYRAVAELSPQFWEFATLPYGNGMTILRKKYSNKYKRK